MKTIVWVTTQFEGFHKWPAAPDEVGFLRLLHRHLFHVKVGVLVGHNDRDVEFFMLKRHVNDIIKMMAGDNMSCEMMAEFILDKLDLLFNYDVLYVDVSEDGENGATISKEMIK